MSRLPITAATLTLSLSLALPSPAQDLPTHELPESAPPESPLPEQAPAAIIMLEPSTIIGTWHGIEPNDIGFNAWEIQYHEDGTYQTSILTRSFDTPDPAAADTDETTDGTWKITDQGSLEFDGGEILFKAARMDDTRIVYTGSFPDDEESIPWTIHEFRGPAPAVIFDLSPFTRRAVPDTPPLEIQSNNLRHLLLGCSVYAVNHGGQFPSKLSALEPSIGAETLAGMKNFTDPDTGRQRSWTLLGGRTINDPHGTVLMHSPPFAGGQRIVGFIDSSVMPLDEDEFAEKMGGQQQ